jgi:hypothetical protein
VSLHSRHFEFYKEIFEIPEFVTDPVLTIGFQDIIGEGFPEGFDYGNVSELFRAKGVTDVRALDLFDHRAQLRYDLNLPVPDSEHERYGLVFDIGSIEHVFDTRQCLENCLRMVRSGGYYFVVTAVKGYLRHGFHTFHPDVLGQALAANGYEISYLRYSSKAGDPLEDPDAADNSLIWLVGKKTRSLGEFEIPQQGVWADYYGVSG